MVWRGGYAGIAQLMFEILTVRMDSFMNGPKNIRRLLTNGPLHIIFGKSHGTLS
jgi:hypothetical protein